VGEADFPTASGTAAELVPDATSLSTLREAAANCQACPLWRSGTQTVFGDGAPHAEVMFVGEQPGDREDVEGEPFVGPAGRELDRALRRTAIPRDEVYITNVVKHFKWRPKGRKRLHQTPNREEMEACRPWLDAEIATVDPAVVVALGATAAKALLGSGFRVSRQRGELHPGPNGTVVTATVHPSSILRAPSDEDRYAAREAFTADLAKIAAIVSSGFAAGFEHEPKAVLYARAQELDVAGRSTMDKAELAAALARRLEERAASCRRRLGGARATLGGGRAGDAAGRCVCPDDPGGCDGADRPVRCRVAARRPPRRRGRPRLPPRRLVTVLQQPAGQPGAALR
jgi:uracil-DNA glycosylase